MNTKKIIRKFKRNSKALSPVVASIILIAVTVAVSVVVAAWMSGSIFNLMGTTEQATVTNIQLTAAAPSTIVSVQNTGTTNVVINSAMINGNISAIASFGLNGAAATTTPFTTAGITLAKGDRADIVVTVPTGTPLVSGTTYQIKLGTEKGNTLAYTQVCP